MRHSLEAGASDYVMPDVMKIDTIEEPWIRATILTPDESVHWDGHEPQFGPGVPANDETVGIQQVNRAVLDGMHEQLEPAITRQGFSSEAKRHVLRHLEGVTRGFLI